MNTTDFRTPGELAQIAGDAVITRDQDTPDAVAAAVAAYVATLGPDARLALRNEYARQSLAQGRRDRLKT